MDTVPKSYEEVKMMQESFWEIIHNRGEWWDICFVPNPLAVNLQKIIPAKSSILEVGCSSGRDARYFASCGHSIIAMDFSQIALRRMMDHARRQGIDAQIIPVHKNVTEGLPDLRPDSIDCFYSRSSLHVDDDTMVQLAKNISLLTKKGGIIAIEGRTEEDTPILESEKSGVGWQLTGVKEGICDAFGKRTSVCNLHRIFLGRSWFSKSVMTFSETKSTSCDLLLRKIANSEIVVLGPNIEKYRAPFICNKLKGFATCYLQF